MQVADGVREAVEAVDGAVGALAAGAKAPAPATVDGLVASWRRLVDLLALGPAPRLLACPHCGALGMRAATRCGRCWEALVPPGDAGEAGGGQA